MATGFLTVPTPVREAPRGGLLGVANVIDITDPHAAHGLQWDTLDCAMPQLAPGLCWSTITVTGPKTDRGLGSDVAVETFALYSGVECFLQPTDEYSERARQQLDGGESFALEQVLKTILDGYPQVGTPADTDLVGLIGTAEQWLSEMYPGLGIIHMDRKAATAASSLNLLLPSLDSTLTTVQGTPVANGGGYGSLAATTYYVAATGLITIWRGPATVSYSHDPTTNRALAIAERVYSIGIDCGGVRLAVNP